MAGTTYKIGPAGNVDGDNWDQKGRKRIYQIFISYGASSGSSRGLERISSIGFRYAEDREPNLIAIFGSRQFRSPGFATVTLNYHNEFIKGVEGYWDTCIKELTIHTNRKSYGPFGTVADVSASHKFKLDIGPNNEFAGFHGTHDSHYVNSIGMYMRPTQAVPSIKPRDTDREAT